ncbi:restriction endonuclease subunit S [Promicromonospora sp. NPDC090134]|uniref:restriction endonuclease subunit S n=1 Tax=Promicromonospora sp. NPDC090134 TaxID=3364408 RepID=UPI0038069396
MSTLPENWRWSTVGEVADTALGKMLDRGKPRGHAHVPYLRNVNVQWGRINTDDILTMELAEDERERFGVRRGDLLVCEGGEVGRAAIWDRDGEYMAYQKALHRVRPRDDVDARYLRYAFENAARTGILTTLTTGSTIAHLPQQNLRRIPVPIPPLSEQRRIVEILEDHLSRLDEVDALLATSLRRIAVLDEAAIVQRLGVGSEVAAMLNGVLPDLAPGWTWKALGDVADVVGGITKDAKRQSDPSYVEVPYLRVANVQRARLDLDKVTMIRVPRAKAEALRLQPGDVLMNEGGDRDKLARGWVWEGQIEGCIHQNHVFRARPHEDAIRPEWLSWCANTYGARWAQRNGKQSVNLASISLRVIREMPVPVPPVEVQDDHLTAIRESVYATSRLRSELEKARLRGANLRVSLFAAAFLGQLTGRPSDLELAEELSATLDVVPASLVGYEVAALR